MKFSLLLVAILLPACFADTWYVSLNGSDNNPGTQAEPFRNIATAVYYARNGDVINVGPGDWKGPSNAQVTIDTNVALESEQGAAATTINVETFSYGFKMQSTSISVRGFTFVGGNGPCMSTAYSGNFAIRDVVFENCTKGAVADSTNTAASVLLENVVSTRSGDPSFLCQGKCIMNVVNCRLGRMVFSGSSVGYISNSTLSFPKSADVGGCLYASSQVWVENTVFEECRSERDGGAVYAANSISLRNCTFTGNMATNGGALFLTSYPPVVEDCRFENNIASLNGGAIYCSPNLILTNSWVANNKAKLGGGLYARSSVNLFRSNVVQNFASDSQGAGGVFCYYSLSYPVDAQSSTVSGNVPQDFASNCDVRHGL